jgi:putative restriction endonuclease
MHKLSDIGYLTVTPELRVDVSHKIKKEYSNEKEYYAYHGQPLRVAPSETDRPTRECLQWHNETVFVP